MAVGSISGVPGSLKNSLLSAQQASGGFAKQLASAVSATDSPDAAAATSATSSKQSYDSALADLQNQIYQLLKNAGIDTTTEIKIEQGTDGKLAVSADHPDAATIQGILNAHPELTGKFQTLAARYRNVAQSDPNGSVLPPELLSSHFLLTLQNGQATGSVA